jgi:hypothetical protein
MLECTLKVESGGYARVKGTNMTPSDFSSEKLLVSSEARDSTFEWSYVTDDYAEVSTDLRS